MKREQIKAYLADMGLPTQDNYELTTSTKTFPDGAHFRTEELPTTVDQYEKLYAVADSIGLAVNRVTDTRGLMFDSDKEIVRKLEIAREHGSEVVMGPGASEQPYDISQQAEIHAIVEGKVRGMDQLVYTVHSMLNAAELGCRGFLMYDEGILMTALKMRKEGMLPPKTKFKVSANISVANAAAIKFWFDMLDQQDAINPVRDLPLPMISAMRQVADNPLDVHMFHRHTVARIMEAPEIVRVGAPLYLKNARFGPGITVEDRALMCCRIVEEITKQYPEARQSKPGAEDMALPAEPYTKW
jgi:hypothetical protein